MDRLARALAQAEEIAARRSGDPEVAELARCVVTLCQVVAGVEGRGGVDLVRAERENVRAEERAERAAQERRFQGDDAEARGGPPRPGPPARPEER